MQLPIDVKALIDEMTDIEAARNTPLSVSVFIDEAAPADLAAHVRNAFASTMPSVRMTVSYLDDTFMPHPTDDVAVIAAGESAVIGPAATAIRAVGVPVMVVTTLPTIVAQKAEGLGHAIPEGDLVSPEIETASEEPYALDDEVRAAPTTSVSRWPSHSRSCVVPLRAMPCRPRRFRTWASALCPFCRAPTFPS